MITETLSVSRCQRPTATVISDSALKVVFLTTLYVDVKEPAVRYIWPQKNSISCRQKSQLLPTVRVSVFIAGTKLSPICSPQMYIERTPY
jgi:hypothetical protein